MWVRVGRGVWTWVTRPLCLLLASVLCCYYERKVARKVAKRVESWAGDGM